jgi:hypothetical protein
MLVYYDVGLAMFALTLIKSGSRTVAYARRLRAKHPFALIYVAVLIASTLWPLVVTGWLLGWGQDDQRP